MAAKNGAIKLVAGNSNRALSEAIGAYLETPLAKAVVRRFADMEIFVEIQENVRGADVYVLQSTSFPTNDHLMELLIIMDALRRASARRITAVIRRAEERFSASMMISSSIRWSFAGNEVDCSTNTSAPRTFSLISTKISMSAKRRTSALASGVCR